MDNTFSFKLSDFRDALATLEEAVSMEKNDIVRDSVIKRFEYTHELSWKTAKLYLRERYGKDVFSPKECFRELRRQGTLSDEETELSLTMCDDRNDSIHTYKEALAEELYAKIASLYAGLLRKIFERVEGIKS
ncbi:hypothetical protein A3I42_01765 [Candidatus Uhrbacteria bacterium RIFCSPLOWO2_02_FULL_49_11]|uniref:Nucleotidyltransferase n=1 Tax=Candidatus Uhrbacteria bacterium RIFCSPLOWO2_02_FULL_49_11 TaxID=1802409 RepID=A0A1F7VB79_9BACT|nr:MAG: hypothetical protein A3I42_01765 [Candidatus Uhrbacteria bacterium RIFCSPLOWO2_02_FULL_49_11]